MSGILIAQLWRLQHTIVPDPGTTMGYYLLGIPLAETCISTGIVVAILGAIRFWRQQNALLRGKIHAGGWEIHVIGIGVMCILVSVFILLIFVDAELER
ncbi:MAG: hypothetical protein M1812_006418 [Candelaria pacifica]|nr:MAG: hypothetical protein M1812_006418 [Candelaria pacifica]